mmetsp:Transcript_68561/g.146684  ORF Transcript_68561/g.146684 Transcript_68561/m.146684 type:complete len:236 (+) Transcript_68561:1061-1768(+)
MDLGTGMSSRRRPSERRADAEAWFPTATAPPAADSPSSDGAGPSLAATLPTVLRSGAHPGRPTGGVGWRCASNIFFISWTLVPTVGARALAVLAVVAAALAPTLGLGARATGAVTAAAATGAGVASALGGGTASFARSTAADGAGSADPWLRLPEARGKASWEAISPPLAAASPLAVASTKGTGAVGTGRRASEGEGVGSSLSFLSCSPNFRCCRISIRFRCGVGTDCNAASPSC